MAAVAGRLWGWVRPALSYRPWGKTHVKDESQVRSGSWRVAGGITSWLWPGDRKQQAGPKELEVEEFWEAGEAFLPVAMEHPDGAPKAPVLPRPPRVWSRWLPSAYTWPEKPRVLREPDAIGDESDYETPPPSPTPPSRAASVLRYLVQAWAVEVRPEHYDICFNFLRHLFDLFVVGFLWTVSPPVRVLLDVFGAQGTVKLWLHGMALFLVSSVGMAGLLWLVQEYLPLFTLLYGLVQVLVISVSLHQSEARKQEDQEPEESGDAEPGNMAQAKGKTNTVA